MGRPTGLPRLYTPEGGRYPRKMLGFPRLFTATALLLATGLVDIPKGFARPTTRLDPAPSGFRGLPPRTRGAGERGSPSADTRPPWRPSSGARHRRGSRPAPHAASSNPRSTCSQSGSRAGARGSGEARTPRCSRIWRTTWGSVIVAITRIFPLHLGHTKTSKPKVRFIINAQSRRLDQANNSPFSRRPQCATVIRVGSTAHLRRGRRVRKSQGWGQRERGRRGRRGRGRRGRGRRRRRGRRGRRRRERRHGRRGRRGGRAAHRLDPLPARQRQAPLRQGRVRGDPGQAPLGRPRLGDHHLLRQAQACRHQAEPRAALDAQRRAGLLRGGFRALRRSRRQGGQGPRHLPARSSRGGPIEPALLPRRRGRRERRGIRHHRRRDARLHRRIEGHLGRQAVWIQRHQRRARRWWSTAALMAPSGPIATCSSTPISRAAWCSTPSP